ncbi:tumor necrosis factor receptor superfamily member 1A isoform X2 [Macrotis lagotis]|uniref:tumor necrosis factor receptor superfamily member 1A isoform X2 n=1 Tax=Macrotis lagotis TaxID=92651 RepID=UPI003D699385
MGHPTLPGLVPLVALALMVGLYLPLAPGMSTQKRHQEKRDIECSPGTHRHTRNASICCFKCHKGTYLAADCGGPGLTPTCKPCEKGTFTEVENYFSSCLSCSVCRKEMGQIEKEPCTSSSNTVCGCKENQFQQKYGQGDIGFFRCVDCNPCINGTIRQPCQEKQDAMCDCNQHFFQHDHKCIPCKDCVQGEKCPVCSLSKSIQPDDSGPVLMSLVIFLGFSCLSLIFIFFFCHYTRWKSKLYLIVCGRQSSPGKEEENERPLYAPAPSTVLSAASHGPVQTPRESEEGTGRPAGPSLPPASALRLDRPDQLYTVVDNVPPTRWKEFIRRLGLPEHDIELFEMQNHRYLREAHYSMLAAWQKSVPQHQATLEVLAVVLTDMGLWGCLQNIEEALKQRGPSRPLPTFPR